MHPHQMALMQTIPASVILPTLLKGSKPIRLTLSLMMPQHRPQNGQCRALTRPQVMPPPGWLPPYDPLTYIAWKQ